MKKKITALVLAAAVFSGICAFAQAPAVNTYNIEQPSETKAIIMCYDEDGKLIYSNLYKSEDGKFSFSLSEEYDTEKKKVYFVDTKEFKNLEKAENTPSPTASPSPTSSPAATNKPSQTAKPTKEPSDGLYEKEVDGVYAPALVKEVASSTNSNGEDVYNVTLFYHSTEMIVEIEDDHTISTAPQEYSFMVGKTAENLEKGDAICLTTNIAGDTVRTIDFIYRPTKEDIVTGDTDYGVNFEKLFVSGNSVADKWSYIKYGEKPSNDKYQYAFGIVGKYDNGTLTLINKSGIVNDVIEIDVDRRANVYSCDVDGKEYEVEIGDVSNIETTIPRNQFDNDEIDLNSDYSYNYALVRLVDDTATDIILYNNYNN